MILSRTVERLLEMVKRVGALEVRFYFSHDRGIPDCFNVPCQQALTDGCSYVVIIEEDVVPPVNALQDMLYASADIAFYDCPLDQGRSTRYFGDILTSGIGCVMFRAEALGMLLPFSTERLYDKEGNQIGTNDGTVYGRQDTDMYIRAHKMGFVVKKAGEADHYHVKEWGTPRSNNGCHKIVKL